ncbi:phospholipid/cholesterol/gamma-HCH transport system substrate-binding protein [Chromobacterium alkanivorans]|jgi:phospholipid/cholesterol/gamma-HCH transport system substrate-binding protein|uniref:outer membrane lipid asymmetry maintenance protein MlaD n=1 Tax=Chromobacterium TaxID=535 RepID=UPI00065306C7|nr:MULTISPECIES: outer membrane lipid asymmetry maintenance protein MlaD [Chromobacterium]KMN83280.1 ABC transporter substrate-binding protein [Chromobacterium sp. LK11]MBN3002118.1 outer membrane lipid asymmetry maintenance protein MlaD [Chromobacterium alkanivorans]MCS3803319.1 phospholipid/cholesterol/gamma-HCH transport system substrate-binding protein [Chromobacterium alkanivorans]MCS3817571.1 phospholipid/cholesterol/gamma-HCH transport system substrate-binding protein [Chromobacterium al
MKRSTIDLWVGIFVALGIAAVAFLSLKVANLVPQSANQTYVLYADFDNVGGLKVKAPVKEAGVVIGRVADIQLNPKTYRARVTLNIDKTYQISDDASASILTAGLLGEQYIGMLQGGSETNLTPGGTITITSSAMVLEQLIGKFMTGFTDSNKSADK